MFKFVTSFSPGALTRWIALQTVVIAAVGCRTDTSPLLHPVKGLGLVSQTAERLTRYGYPLDIRTGGIERLQPVRQGKSETEFISSGTDKIYLGPKPAKSLQPVRVMIVSASEASMLGALDTCLAFSGSRAIVCSENFEVSVGGQIFERVNKYISSHPSPKTDPIAAAITAGGPKPMIYSWTLGFVEFVILHELSHVYRRDAQVIDESNASSVAGLCGGPDPAPVSNELIADQIAVDMLDDVADFALNNEDFSGKKFSMLATESLRFMLITTAHSLETAPDRCAFYREFCRSSKAHPPSLQRLVLNASIVLSNRSGDNEIVKTMGSLFDTMRKVHDSGTCGALR